MSRTTQVTAYRNPPTSELATTRWQPFIYQPHQCFENKNIWKMRELDTLFTNQSLTICVQTY